MARNGLIPHSTIYTIMNELISYNNGLTHFCSIFSFYTPWEHQKAFGFLVFLEGINESISQK